MPLIPINKADDDRVQIALWRAAPNRERVREDLLRHQCVPVIHTVEPWPRRDHRGFWRRDLRKPLPIESDVADWVYVYHIFEHVSPPEAQHLIRELYRVIKPGGILRVSISDTERYIRDYLNHLELAVRDPGETTLLHYEWSLLRVIDQAVRHRPSGRIGEFRRSGRFDPNHLRDMFGDIFHSDAVPAARRSRIAEGLAIGPKHLFFGIWRYLRRRWHRHDPRVWGECDKWANDRVYMRELARHARFEGFSVKTFDTSDIPSWEMYDFDRSIYGGDRESEPSAYFEYFK